MNFFKRRLKIYHVSCGKAEGKNCALCKNWNGGKSGTIICDEPFCKYKFSLKNFFRAIQFYSIYNYK